MRSYPSFLKYPVESQYNEIHVGGAKMQKTEQSQGYHVYGTWNTQVVWIHIEQYVHGHYF